MNNVSKLHYSVLDADIRMMVDENQKPWFVVADVANMLDIKNINRNMEDFPDGVRSMYPIVDSLGRTQNAAVVSEAGLYRLIFKSRKPEAEAFVAWVTEEVLPQIRRTGCYVPQKVNAIPTAKQRREDLAEALDVADRLAKMFSTGVPQAYLLEQDYAYYEDTSTHLLPELARHEATVELEKAHITFDPGTDTRMAAIIPVADFETHNAGELARSYKNKHITSTLINKWLCEDGFQTKISKSKYAKTKRSKDIAVEKMSLSGDSKGKKYITGWKKSNELLACLNKHVEEFINKLTNK